MRFLAVTERQFGVLRDHAINVDAIKEVSKSQRSDFGCTIHFTDRRELDVQDSYESVVGELLKVK